MKYDMFHFGITKGILTDFPYRTWKRYFFNPRTSKRFIADFSYVIGKLYGRKGFARIKCPFRDLADVFR